MFNLTVFVIVLTTFLFLYNLEIAGVISTGERIIGERMEFHTIEKRVFSGHKEEAYYVINDAYRWAETWSHHIRNWDPKPPPPEVDFSQTTIIAVFMGQFSTGGYGIEVKEIIDMGVSIEVKVEKTYPGKGCGVTEAFSQPYHIVKVDKMDKQVIFNTSSRTIVCD